MWEYIDFSRRFDWNWSKNRTYINFFFHQRQVVKWNVRLLWVKLQIVCSNSSLYLHPLIQWNFPSHSIPRNIKSIDSGWPWTFLSSLESPNTKIVGTGDFPRAVKKREWSSLSHTSWTKGVDGDLMLAELLQQPSCSYKTHQTSRSRPSTWCNCSLATVGCTVCVSQSLHRAHTPAEWKEERRERSCIAIPASIWHANDPFQKTSMTRRVVRVRQKRWRDEKSLNENESEMPNEGLMRFHTLQCNIQYLSLSLPSHVCGYIGVIMWQALEKK